MAQHPSTYNTHKRRSKLKYLARQSQAIITFIPKHHRCRLCVLLVLVVLVVLPLPSTSLVCCAALFPRSDRESEKQGRIFEYFKLLYYKKGVWICIKCKEINDDGWWFIWKILYVMHAVHYIHCCCNSLALFLATVSIRMEWSNTHSGRTPQIAASNSNSNSISSKIFSSILRNSSWLLWLSVAFGVCDVFNRFDKNKWCAAQSYIHNKMKYSEFSRHVQIIFQKKRKEKKMKRSTTGTYKHRQRRCETRRTGINNNEPTGRKSINQVAVWQPTN